MKDAEKWALVRTILWTLLEEEGLILKVGLELVVDLIL